MAHDYPTAHTLAGVLTRLAERGLHADPEVERRLDLAFAKHDAALKAFCRRQLPAASMAEVEEVVQEVVLEAFRQLPGYEPREHFKAFLFQIARYKCANVRRKKSTVATEDGLVDELTSSQASMLVRLECEQLADLLSVASRNVLETWEQEIVYSRWVLEMSLPELVREHPRLKDVDGARGAVQRCKRRLLKEVPRLLDERGLSDSFLLPGG